MGTRKGIHRTNWVKYWKIRTALGFNEDDIMLVSHSELIVETECAYTLRNRTGKMNGSKKFKLGFNGRKCTR